MNDDHIKISTLSQVNIIAKELTTYIEKLKRIKKDKLAAKFLQTLNFIRIDLSNTTESLDNVNNTLLKLWQAFLNLERDINRSRWLYFFASNHNQLESEILDSYKEDFIIQQAKANIVQIQTSYLNKQKS